MKNWAVISLNLLLGVILWLGFCTDASFPGIILDLVFPVIVGLLGFIALLKIRAAKETPRVQRIIRTLFLLPSLIGGVGFILLAIIPIILFPLLILWVSEVAGETMVQESVSPNGFYEARAYFRPVGAYTGGNGRVFIRVKYRGFPLIERDIFIYKTFKDPSEKDFIRWIDANEIAVDEKSQVVKVGFIKFQMPVLIDVPVKLMEIIMK